MSVAFDTGERFSARLGRHLSALAGLAWPVMLSRAGILLMALVDVIMLGRYDTIALAEASLALGLFIPIMVTCVGLQMGVLSIVSRRSGAGDAAACVAAWRRGLPWAALTSGAGAALIWFGETWDQAAKAGPEIEHIYWREVPELLVGGNGDDATFAIRKFISENRGRHALALAERASKQLPTDLLVEVLQEAAIQPFGSGEETNETTMLQYHVAEILQALDERDDMGEDVLVQLEWA